MIFKHGVVMIVGGDLETKEDKIQRYRKECGKSMFLTNKHLEN